MFKRRDSVISEFSSISDVDLNIRKSKSQYQMLSTSKQPFETSDLSKHPIKNLQLIINVLTDQKKNEEADIEEVSDTSQKIKTGYSFSGGSSKPNKGKGKDTRDQSSSRKISPASGGGDGGNSSSSDKDLEYRKL